MVLETETKSRFIENETLMTMCTNDGRCHNNNGNNHDDDDDDDDTTCGIWFIKGKFLQKFAGKKTYVTLFGLLGCLYAASHSYYNGILTTVEKRFAIPSTITGAISIGNDISQLLVSLLLTYYASRGHQPRWIGVGMYTVVLFCFMSAIPHFLYGSGDDALSLTKEFGIDHSKININQTLPKQSTLCNAKSGNCDAAGDNIAPPIILFLAQFVAGIGGPLYHTLGISYMDDNVKRSKTPLLLSLSYFFKSLGPVLGYFISSVCLKLYISPTLTPIIQTNDPRWLGAYWLGWLVIGGCIFILSTLIMFFPKTLPSTKLRKTALALSKGQEVPRKRNALPASVADMKETFLRLIKNKVFMCNNVAAVFFLLGIMPFFTFLPKYIEVIYKQSASFASLVTGSVGLAFSALGILLSGVIITKYRPRARPMAAWNIFIGFVLVAGVIFYAFLECPEASLQNLSLKDGQLQTDQSCNHGCHCDYVKYNPVCSSDGRIDFISPCHAGCKQRSSETIYSDCSCIPKSNTTSQSNSSMGGEAIRGTCPIDCNSVFLIFIIVNSSIQFLAATGRAPNSLIGIRCVREEDKAIAMGLGLTFLSIAAFIPSPILAGYIIDKSCIMWGKTCSGKGNCWLYDSKSLRYSLNFTAAFFVSIGVMFDVGVWYFVKDISIFDEEPSPKKDEKKEKITF